MDLSPTQQLGALRNDSGVRFAIYSGSAQQIDLCLFETAGAVESRRIPTTRASGGVWSVHVAGARPGQLYGYRVHGPYAPQEGLWFNPHKLLLDPYAKAMTGLVPAEDVLLGYDLQRHDRPDQRDSAGAMPKCVVVDERWDWAGDQPPRISWADTVIYECHVKGLTKLHPGVEPALRGTYLGLASPAMIEHLVGLGVTAVELLPIQSFVTERRLAQMGLVNYWGYNTIGFYSPDVRYATAPERAVAEFRTMVRSLHAAGIEVILDVVYNHTAEGDERGPMLSFRGIDNRVYYHVEPEAPGRYVNHTACGNTVNTLHPRTQQLIMDSLRYWVNEMHVDGFRFDLAPALCRQPAEVDPYLRFYNAVLQDPVLRETKLLVEPWDAGPRGLWLGAFPPAIHEWNGRYRDCVRRFWRAEKGQLPEFASRLAGSSDVFVSRRTPLKGVNYVTCHDGATLHDLVTYARKHNEANGEENRDGPHDDFGQNFGIEGETEDAAIREHRERMKRNLLTTLLFSQGVPMLTAGDEMGRTQRGNTNAYCQDNEISWVDWTLDPTDSRLLEFAQRVLAIRRDNPAFRRDAYFEGKRDEGMQDVVWMDEAGRELTEAEWHDPQRRSFMMMVRENGGREAARILLLLINAGVDAKAFRLPISVKWNVMLRTDAGGSTPGLEESATVSEGSLMLLSLRGTA